MPPFGTNFNPADVMMGQPGRAGTLYLGGGATRKSGPPWPGPMPQGPDQQLSATPAMTTVPNQPFGVLGPESIRAAGKGPFDPQYRQNLATYAGGQFARPSGGMNFNPTDPSTFPGMATGGGSAPVQGMPMSLLGQALGGNPFSWISPQSQPSAEGVPQRRISDIPFWLEQFLRNGRGQRMMT